MVDPWKGAERADEGSADDGMDRSLELTRLRAELRAVRRDQLRLRTTVASVSELVAVVAEDRSLVSLNSAGQSLLGYEADQALGLQICDLLAPADARRLAREIGPAFFEGEQRWTGDVDLRRRDGTLIVASVEIRSVTHSGGEHESIWVARLRRAENTGDDEGGRLLARLRSLTAVLENTSDFVAMADTGGQILYVNPAGMELVGRAGEDPQTLQVSDLQAPRDYERLITETFPFVREHGSWLGELFLWHADGSEIPVSQVITVVRDERGELVGYATISRDITELKRSEAERQKAVDAAEAANRAKTVFLANMSHELRTPLNAILGFAQLMIRGEGLSDEHYGHLEVINRSGEHLLTLINDVLEMSTIEAGRLTLNERAFDPRRLFADLVDMLRLRVEEKGLALVVEVDPGVPKELRGDPAKLRQVVLNLLGNAIKFTDVGSVRVRAELRGEFPQHRLWVEVEDTGRGISVDELPRLFRPFEQTKSGRVSQDGTGLGLTISQHFVRMMSGEIEVRSEPGVGSSFSFEVEVAIGPQAVEPGAVEVPSARQIVGLAPGQPRWRLLVVEDRWQNREILRSFLEPVGFDIREAVNGAEAVAIAEEWAPHLIWMDIRMPVMDGVEATRRIKALPGGAAMVVIAVSANVFEGDRSRMEEVGCADFVAKPFRGQRLFEILTRHLGCTYLYGDEERSSRPAVGAVSGAEPLPPLPRGVGAELRGAAEAADPVRLRGLLAELPGEHQEFVQRVEAALHEFAYGAIMELLVAVEEVGAGSRG